MAIYDWKLALANNIDGMWFWAIAIAVVLAIVIVIGIERNLNKTLEDLPGA